MLERHLPPSADLAAMFPNRRRLAAIPGDRTVFEAEAYDRYLLVVVPELAEEGDVVWEEVGAADVLVQVLEFVSEDARGAYVEEQGWGAAPPDPPMVTEDADVDLASHFTRPNAPGSPVLDAEEPPTPPDPPEGGVYLHLWTATADPGDVPAVREGLAEAAAHLEASGGSDVTVALRTLAEAPARVAVVSTWTARSAMEEAVARLAELVPEVQDAQEDVLPTLGLR